MLWSYNIFIKIVSLTKVRLYFYLYFSKWEESLGILELSDLPNVTYLGSDRARAHIRPFCCLSPACPTTSH